MHATHGPTGKHQGGRGDGRSKAEAWREPVLWLLRNGAASRLGIGSLKSFSGPWDAEAASSGAVRGPR